MIGDQPNPELKYGPMGTFDPALFAKMIQADGLTFWWSRAIECPCRMTDSNQWDVSCAYCGGDGWWYVSPEDVRDRHRSTALQYSYVPVECTFAQAGLNPSITETFGGWGFADALMTYQSEMRVAFRDRFIGVDQVMAYGELILSGGPGSVIRVGKSHRSTVDQRKAIRYEPIKVNIVVDQDRVRYYKGEDFRILEATIDEPQRIQWLAGKGPAEDHVVSIHYNCRPVWLVDDATYGIQGLKGPESTLKGVSEPRVLPTTFKVRLDYLTARRGT